MIPDVGCSMVSVVIEVWQGHTQGVGGTILNTRWSLGLLGPPGTSKVPIKIVLAFKINKTYLLPIEMGNGST